MAVLVIDPVDQPRLGPEGFHPLGQTLAESWMMSARGLFTKGSQTINEDTSAHLTSFLSLILPDPMARPHDR